MTPGQKIQGVDGTEYVEGLKARKKQVAEPTGEGGGSWQLGGRCKGILEELVGGKVEDVEKGSEAGLRGC